VTDPTAPVSYVAYATPVPSKKLPRLTQAEYRAILEENELGSHLLETIAVERKAIRRLKDEVVRAETNFLHDLARRHQGGELSQRDLARIYIGLRSLGRTGMATRWDEVMPFKRFMIENQRFNEPHTDGRWYGSWPIEYGASIPEPGWSVVYYLYDGSLECCYIGSSGDLRNRLKWHRSDGKIFDSWMAEPHESRAAAYAAEDEILRTRHALPRYNVKIGA
jgi:hypothetical protein